MSTSAGVEINAGSRSATSLAMGKLSVWSAASASAGGGVGLFGLQTASNSTAASRTLSDSEDHLAGALPLRHHRERPRRLGQRQPRGNVGLDLARRIKLEQALRRRGYELRRP